MGIKTIPLRSIEEKVDNIYEAVVVMSGQAKRVLDEQGSFKRKKKFKT